MFIVAILAIFVIPGLVLYPILFAPKSFSVNPTQDLEFRNFYAKNANVNLGITVKILSSYDNSTDTDFGGLAEYAVYNHTDESIEFQNIGFGLKIFTLGDKANSWSEVKDTISFMDNPTIIMPSGKVIDSFGNLQENSIFLRYSDFFKDAIPARLRFYVNGIGQKTHLTYVAYVDLLLNR